jgi:tetratricopeptide (TPR) repeat protein
VKAFQDAISLLERGRDTAALKAAEQAKQLAPRSGAAREVLGLAMYRTERYRDALRELLAYRRITGRLDQNHLIADSHRALGAPQKALEPVRDVLRAHRVPDEVRAEAAVVGSSALADLRRFDEALGMLRSVRTKAEGARPHDLRVWYVIGDILERAGRPREAEEEFRRIMRHDAGAYDVAERVARLSQGPDRGRR